MSIKMTKDMSSPVQWPPRAGNRRGSSCAILSGQRHNNRCLALRVSHDPGHVLNLKFDFHHILIIPKEKGDNAKAAWFCLFRAPVTWLNPFFISKCLLQVKVIHQTVLAVIRTVNSRWLLRMGPRCRTAESTNTNLKFKEVPGSYAARSPWISYIPIEIRWLRVWKAMLKMKTELLK